MVNFGKHVLMLVSLFTATLALTGCAVKPLKAPCSRNDAAGATASFAFQGDPSAAPISSVDISDAPSLSVEQVSTLASCGPMRFLERGVK